MDQNVFLLGGATSRITKEDWRKMIIKKLQMYVEMYVSWVGECASSPVGGPVWIGAWKDVL